MTKISKILYKSILGAFLVATIASCGLIQKVPVETKTIYNYVDSTIVTYHDSTIVIEVPKEYYRDYTSLLDTLRLETSVSESKAWIDTTNHILAGELQNKDTVLERIVYLPSEEHIVYRDSIVTKEIPIPVEVVKTHYPKSYWFLLGYAILSVIVLGVVAYFKIKY